MLHYYAQTVCSACGSPASIHVTQHHAGQPRSYHFCAAHGFNEFFELVRLEMQRSAADGPLPIEAQRRGPALFPRPSVFTVSSS